MKCYSKGYKFSLFMLVLTVAGMFTAGVIFVDMMYATTEDPAFAAAVENEQEYTPVSTVDIENDFENYIKELDNSEYIHNDIEQWLDTMEVKVCTEQDAEKAKIIAEETPLDLETAITVVDYSNKFDLDVSLILGVIDLESEFQQYEVGAAQDRGYMQIIPSTERWLFKEYGDLLSFEYNPEQIFEPEYNIGVGCLYLYELKLRHGNNVHRVLSEYNRGPYNLRRYYAKHGTYETTYSKTVKSRADKYVRYNNL